MTCPQCERANADTARFCDSCGAALPAAAPSQVPVTGPTTVLDVDASLEPIEPLAPRAAAALPLEPIEPLVPRAATALPMRSGGATRPWREINGGLWLIGLGLLFLTGTFWPGILVLAGVSAYLEQRARGNERYALRSLLVPVGIALLFWTGTF